MFSKQAFDAHATQVHDVKTHQPGYIVASQNIRKQPIQQPQQTTGQVVLEKGKRQVTTLLIHSIFRNDNKVQN